MVVSRQFQGEADYSAMRALLMDLMESSGPAVYCTVGDLDWWRWTDPDVDAGPRLQVWYEGDRLLGFAFPWVGQVEIFTTPDHRTLEWSMFEWAERNRPPEAPGEWITMETWCFEDDGFRIDVLRERNYTRTDKFINWAGRLLSDPMPEAPLPVGYAIRQMRGEEIRERVAVHRNAFWPSRMTEERYANIMRAPTYRPELDLVVTAPDGSFAAFLNAWYDPSNCIGIFEPVGCHSGHRQRGLARALVVEGMRRLKKEGAYGAFVASGGRNAAANALYDTTGFRLVNRKWLWEKDL